MGLAQFSLDLRAARPPVLTVNGQSIAVVGLTVRHVPPSLPQLILELAGEVSIEGEGIVVPDSGGDTAADLRNFLSNLDPDKLDDTAADLFGQDGHDGKVITGPGQAFVEAILRMIDTKGA